jgi:hypothetical protein
MSSPANKHHPGAISPVISQTPSPEPTKHAIYLRGIAANLLLRSFQDRPAEIPQPVVFASLDHRLMA